jgi:DNA gyrase/topoisomerase IV subunit B
MVCKDGVVTKVTDTPSTERGTIVKFRPDYSFFGMDNIDDAHIKMIEERVKSLSLGFENIRFKFNGKLVRVKFQDFFGESIQFKNDKCVFGITKSDGNFQTHSLVNGLSVKDGQHIDTFLDVFMNEFRDYLKRKKKVEITRARLKNHLRIHCVINGFKALKFDSQTKERVTNSTAECKEAIGEFEAKVIVKKLMNDNNLIEEICAYTRLQEDLLAKKDLAGLEKKKKIKSDKYFAAIGDTKRIFVVEGDSASGGLIKCLGRQGNAFYALKGVPLNVLEVNHQKFMANKELSELYQIITTYPEAEICIATDADADGSRIRGLLTLFMHKYFEGHFASSRVRVLKTPLAIGKKNNEVKEWAYNFTEVNSISQKLDISYVKGLGSWSVNDLRKIIETDTMEKMLPFIYIDKAELLNNWFSGETSDFRKEKILEAAPFDIMKV